MKIFNKTLLLLFAFLLLVPAMHADGIYIPAHDIHMYEPNQKAVIVWDGITETMILSSTVKSDDISNFAWVVPIQSSSKPEITKGDVSIFKDLILYFERETHYYSRGLGTLKAEAAGVEVIESKKIDIYDLTVLKATSSSDLINWLNANGYEVLNKVKPVLDAYVAKGNFYFVANKINLRNKFSTALNFLDRFKLGEIAEVQAKTSHEVARLFSAYSTREVSDSLIAYDAVDVSNRLTRNIMENLPYDESLGRNWQDLLFVSKEKYEKLQGQYGNNAVIFKKMYDFGEIMFTNSDFDSLSCWNEYKEDKYGNREEIPIFVGSGKKYHRYCTHDISETFGGISNAREIYSANFPKLKQDYQTLSSDLKNTIDQGLGSIGSETMSNLKELSRSYSDLHDGLSTPLKFEFRPATPFYPMEISSLSPGSTVIEVYVITDDYVADKNNVLKIDSSKKIDYELAGKLAKYVDLGDAKYITRLSYRGDLKKLNADAEFVKSEPITFEEERPHGILQGFFNWLLHLFG